MLISVAICTWNRAPLLRRALQEMTQLIVPPGVEWELLIVDNNSTDATESIVAEYVRRLPVRRLFEPTPGKSNALNLAIREARGDYILWTDDDALVDRQWLAAYARAIEERPRAVFFGGPVHPWFAEPPPTWLKRAWLQVPG
jgi:glycosyltransferase involved in cell wall biosynthesis